MMITGMASFALVGATAATQGLPAADDKSATEQADPERTSASGTRNSPPNSGFGEIVVTARRREESQQSVPIAITALSAEDLKAANVTRMEDLGTVAPALVIAPVFGRSYQPAFAIRGQRQESSNFTTDSSVAIYVADAVQARVFGLGQSLFDLESVQVLKGPQGTLFGRNTTGGAILFQPRRPTFDHVKGYVEARYGNYNRFDLQGAINVPLTASLAVRLGYNRTRREGFVKNVSDGNRLNSEHTDSVRGIVLFEPSDGFSNTLYVDYFKARGGGSAARVTDVNPNGLAQLFFPGFQAAADHLRNDLSFYEIEGDWRSYNSGSNLGFVNVTEGEVSDYVKIKNIASYRRVKSTESQDSEGTNFPIIGSLQIDKVDQMTEEFQVIGQTPNDRFDYIVGAYYFVEDGRRDLFVSALGGTPNPRIGYGTNLSRSVFAQGDYKIKDNLTLTLGGRYTWDRRSFTQDYRSVTTGDCIYCASREADFGAATYTVNLAWQIDPRKLLYIATRRGYRSGGFNSSPGNDLAFQPFDPETITDYEIGLKADWSFGRSWLRTNLAAYRADYNDVQRQVLRTDNNTPVTSIFNAASAKIEGAEAEVQFQLVPAIQFSGSLAYVDTTYKTFEEIGPAGVIDRSGNRFAYVPRWTYTLGAKVDVPIGSGSARLVSNLDWYHQSGVYFAEFNEARVYQEGYGLLSARIALEDALRTGLTISLWGRNLLDRKYYAAGGDLYSSLGFVFKNPGEPRTYGIEMTMDF